MEEVAEEAAMATGGEEATVPPEAALEVVVRSPKIQDAEPVRSAPMNEAPRVVVAEWSCSRTIRSTRRRWLGTWRRSAKLSSG
jgi:hypothetical protein